MFLGFEDRVHNINNSMCELRVFVQECSGSIKYYS